MKAHTKLYLNHFGFTGDEFIPCEVCETRAVDIHHINCRGMGGTTKQEDITNLMALCRKCHEWYGDRIDYIEFLQNIHNKYLNK